MFSSHESLNKDPVTPDVVKASANQTKLIESSAVSHNLNLKLDFGMLSDNEEELDTTYNIKDKQENQKLNNGEDLYALNTITITSRSTGRQQIKPNHIPNLALDAIDDEKSQSVAASMTKPIDYHKEMELIYNQNVLTTLPPANNNKKKVDAKLKPIKQLSINQSQVINSTQIELNEIPSTTPKNNSKLNSIFTNTMITSNEQQQPTQLPRLATNYSINQTNKTKPKLTLSHQVFQPKKYLK
jgi:hypothetical protein